jgi:hypothetical protein
MLRFDAMEAFEQWLQTCPLDSRSLTYSLSRGGDGLTVSCQWRMAVAHTGHDYYAAAAHLPVPAAAASPPPRTASPPPTEAAATEAETSDDEVARMKATMERIKSMMPPGASALMESLASGEPTPGEQPGRAAAPGGGALAAALLQQRLERSSDAPPNSDEVRAALSMCSGVAFPKPPGASFP